MGGKIIMHIKMRMVKYKYEALMKNKYISGVWK